MGSLGDAERAFFAGVHAASASDSGNGPGGGSNQKNLTDEELRAQTSDLGLGVDKKVNSGRTATSYARKEAQAKREASGKGEIPYTTVNPTGMGVDFGASNGRTANSGARQALQDKKTNTLYNIEKSKAGKLTWDNVDSVLDNARGIYSDYASTISNHYGERTDLTEDDKRHILQAGGSILGDMDFEGGLEGLRRYGTEQETKLRSQTDLLRGFMEEHIAELDPEQAAAMREELDKMDEIVGSSWRQLYGNQELRDLETQRNALEQYIAEQEKLQHQQQLYADRQESIQAARTERRNIENRLSEIDELLTFGTIDDERRAALQQEKQELLSQRQTAQANVEQAEKAVEWDGRQEMIDQYAALQKEWQRLQQSGNLEDIVKSNEVGRQMLELRDKIRQGDMAVGNGARDYTFADRAGGVYAGTAANIFSSLYNAGATMADAYHKENAYGQERYNLDLMNDQNRALQEQTNAQLAQSAPEFMTSISGTPQTAEQKREGRIEWYESEPQREKYNKMYQVADNFSEASARELQLAKEGLSELGQAGVDIAQNVLEMGFDAAVGTLTGGGSLASMYARTFGGSAQEARQAGADLEQQLQYGGAKAAIEVLTEKLFDGVAGVYGKGGADEITEALIGKLADSDIGRTFLRVVLSGAGEGIEEVISSMLSPLAEALYKDESIRELYGQLNPADVLYDFIIGAAIGALGGGTSIVTGQNAARNAELRTQDALRNAGIGSVSNQVGNAWDVLSGRATSAEVEARESAGRAAAAEQMGGTNALNEYVNNQKLSQYGNVAPTETATPVEQIARQTVQQIINNGRINNTTANQILSNPDLKAAAEWALGISLDGMTTNEARTAMQRAARESNYRFRQGEATRANAEAAETARVEQEQAEAQARAEAEAEEAARPRLSPEAEAVRDILQNQGRIRDILNNSAYREALQQMFPGLQLDSRNDVAWRQIQDLGRQFRNGEIEIDQGAYQVPETAAPEAETLPQNGEVPAGEAQGQRPVTEKLPPVNKNRKATEVPSQSHSIEGQMGAYGQDYEAPSHVSKPEIESLTNAMNRASSDMNGEMQSLINKEAWTGEDIDTALVINGKLLVDAIKNNDFSAVDAWLKVVEPHKSEAGRALQALSKWARGGRAVISDTQTRLAEDKTLDPAEKSAVMNKVLQFADRFDTIEDGDLESVRKLILDMNKARNTGTFIPGMFEKFLNKQTDFSYLKEYAMRQLMSIPNESLTKPDLGKKLKTWQSLAQLMRITTTLRNVLGNESFGILDFIPQNTVGTWLDALVSAVDGTGIRTVGMSSSWLDSEARKAMGQAIERSMMEIAGDVYMGGSNAYGTQGVRTFKASDANVLNRILSRAEQLSGYALQTTDEAASARQSTAYMNMLERLNGERLSEEQKQELADQITQYRLFKNNGRFKRFSQNVHDTLNGLAGVGGEVQGGQRKGGFGAAELLGLSYPGVPANLGAKPLEYSPANVAKGVFELIKYFSEKGKTGEHNLALRQTAVMDIARGVTGTALISALSGLFKSGVLKYYDDEDDYDVQQQNRAEGKNGTLINLSAWQRLIDGDSVDPTPDDTYMNIGYLQPINSLMAVSHFINKDMDDGLTAGEWAADFAKGSWNGLLDMPVMQSISSLADVLGTKYDEETGGSKLVDSMVTIGGNAVNGMIPGLLSQGAKAMDTVERDTSGDTAFERVVNATKKSLPGNLWGFGRESLPVKYDSLGNPVMLDESTYDRVMNALVRPGTVGKLHVSEASEIIGGIIEATGNKSIMPDSRAPATIKIDGEPENLTASEKRTFKREYGQMVTDLTLEAAGNEAFKNATPEQQALILAEIEKYAKDRAKASIVNARGGTYESAYQTLLDGTYDADGDMEKPPLEEKNLPEYFMFSNLAKSATTSQDYASMQNLYSGFADLDENTQKVLAAKGDKIASALLGTDKSGGNYDIPKLNPENVAQYAEYQDNFGAAYSARDTNAIDQYLDQYANLDPNTQEVVFGKNKANTQLPYTQLLELHDLGVGSANWFEYKRAQNAAQVELDANTNTAADVKMLGLANADIPEEQKAIMIESDALDIGKNMRGAYSALSQYGLNAKDVYEWFEDADWSLDTKTGQYKSDSILNPLEVAAKISRMDGLSQAERSGMYRAFYDLLHGNGDPKYDKWVDKRGKPYTYDSEIKYLKRTGYLYGKSNVEEHTRPKDALSEYAGF